VGVLGLSFKAGTDDLRESPLVTLVEMLIGKGLTLSVYDGSVSSAGLIGANREYIEREIPHIWSLMRGSVSEVVETSDVIVIGNNAAEFREIQPLLKGEQIVIDLVRAFEPRAADDGHYRGISW
jgi:GDP-mannose 6-dehydrogenase